MQRFYEIVLKGFAMAFSNGFAKLIVYSVVFSKVLNGTGVAIQSFSASRPTAVEKGCQDNGSKRG